VKHRVHFSWSITGRTIRQFDVMKSSCCLTGAGVMAPKGTARSSGTLIDPYISSGMMVFLTLGFELLATLFALFTCFPFPF
jgi:hypothetical protein